MKEQKIKKLSLSRWSALHNTPDNPSYYHEDEDIFWILGNHGSDMDKASSEFVQRSYYKESELLKLVEILRNDKCVPELIASLSDRF